MEHLLSGFLEEAKTRPHSVALFDRGQEYTYFDLDRRSNEIALALHELSPTSNEIIALYMQRGHSFIVSALGVLKAGHCYMPLDPNYPEERLQHMVKIARPKICLHTGDSRLDCELNFHQESLQSHADAFDPINGDSAYIIFTSGSTGRPKGINMAVNALKNLMRHEALGPKRCLHFAPISFDVHFQEIFGTLNTGGIVVVAGENERKDTKALADLLIKARVNKLYLPYVALNALAAPFEKEVFPELKEVVVSGEQLRINDRTRNFFKRNQCALINQYGPSECHVVFEKRLSDEVDSWGELPSIGRAIPNIEYRILEDGKNAVEGELYLSGACLAHGYINDPERTNEAFIYLDGKRFYKTGDLVKIDLRGELEFLGRSDGQVKIKGHRVELSEVECLMEKASGLEAACATVTVDGATYLSGHLKGKFNANEVLNRMRAMAPDYLVPKYLQEIDSFPLAPSGKLQRDKLPAPKKARPELSVPYAGPRNRTEKALLQFWEACLGAHGIGIDDKFYELGGDSLIAIELSHKIQEVFPAVSIATLYQYDTIRKQAQFITKLNEKSAHDEALVKNSERDVAIIAMTGRFPGANDAHELWDLLENGKCSIKGFSKEEVHPSVSEGLVDDENYRFICAEWEESKEFDHEFFDMTPREAEIMDPQQRKFMELCHEALELAWPGMSCKGEKIGIYAGQGQNTYQNNFKDHLEKISALGEFNTMLSNDKDFLCSRAAFKLGLTGPAVNINTGCSTSLVAVAMAVEAIRAGHCDKALAGGITVFGQKKKGYLYEKNNILSKDGACRPYSDKAHGTVFGEGAAVFVLKRKDLAIKDGDTVLATIRGVGLNNDGHDKASFTAPGLIGHKDACVAAMKDAGVRATEISFIEGHGTGTEVGDPIECEALSLALRECGWDGHKKVLLGSLKANIGHLASAAGAAGLFKAVLSLNKRTAPSIVGLSKLGPHFDFENSPLAPVRESTPLGSGTLVAGVSSLGVGGTNAHIIIEEGIGRTDNGKEAPIQRASEDMLFISGKSEAALVLNQTQALKINAGEVARSLAHRDHWPMRSFKVKDGSWSPGKKIKNWSKKIALFPGQSAQYLGMGLELRERFEAFRLPFDQCAERLRSAHSIDLKKALLNEDLLNDTRYTQPCLFVFQYCMGKLLESLGATPDFYIGHSVGEFAIAALNGVFTVEDGTDLIVKRGELMSRLPEGGMAVVEANEDLLRPHLREDVQIAARNADDLIVISGKLDGLQLSIDSLGREGITCKRLNSSRAFHSEMMRPILKEFEAFCAGITFKAPKRKIISCLTGQVESVAFTKREYWSRHIIEPVDFKKAIQVQMEEDVLFMELGPRAGLSYLCELCAEKLRTPLNIISFGKGRNEIEEFLKGAGELWASGVEQVAKGLLPPPSRHVPFPYQFAKHVHWLDQKERGVEENKQKTTSSVGAKEKLLMEMETITGIRLSEKQYDMSFYELGMDSLFLTQMAAKLKRRYELNVTSKQLAREYETFNKLLAHFSTAVATDTPKKVPDALDEKAAQQKDLQALLEKHMLLLEKHANLLERFMPQDSLEENARHEDFALGGRLARDKAGRPMWVF